MGVRPWGRERLHKNMWWFNFSTICASFQNVTCCDELWGYKRRWEEMLGKTADGKKAGRSDRGRRRKANKHGIYAHNQASQFVNNGAVID